VRWQIRGQQPPEPGAAAFAASNAFSRVRASDNAARSSAISAACCFSDCSMWLRKRNHALPDGGERVFAFAQGDLVPFDDIGNAGDALLERAEAAFQSARRIAAVFCIEAVSLIRSSDALRAAAFFRLGFLSCSRMVARRHGFTNHQIGLPMSITHDSPMPLRCAAGLRRVVRIRRGKMRAGL